MKGMDLVEMGRNMVVMVVSRRDGLGGELLQVVMIASFKYMWPVGCNCVRGRQKEVRIFQSQVDDTLLLS